jgi:hypothetical protein
MAILQVMCHRDQPRLSCPVVPVRCLVRACMRDPPCACAVGEWEVNSKIIDVLLSKDRPESHRVMVSRGEHRAREKVCQSNILWGQCETKISRYALIEMSLDE